MHYVYVIQNELGDLYIGYSQDIQTRIKDHNSGKGARMTRRAGPWKLIYLEGYLNQKDVLGREKFLKGGSGLKYIKKQLRHYLLAA